MGIQLGTLIGGNEIRLEELRGKTMAIDAFNFLYQFLAIIRGPGGEPLKDSRGRITSHVSGLFYRTINLLEAGIKPVYVFDGPPPHFKRAEVEKRKAARAEAAVEWKAALERGELEEARKAAMRAVTVTDEIIGDARNLLHLMGIPVVQATSEGEALAAVMAERGDAWAVAGQDFDTLLFGAPRLVRNLGTAGRKKYIKSGYVTVNPDLIVLKDVLKQLDIGREQLIILGILVGTDYNQGGIRGIGPKKALKLVKEKKSLEAVLAETGWSFEVSAQDIFDFYMNPPKAPYEIIFKPADGDALRNFLLERDFSAERVDNAIARLPKKKGSLHEFGG
jgi:flap endonuclease-1